MKNKIVQIVILLSFVYFITFLGLSTHAKYQSRRIGLTGIFFILPNSKFSIKYNTFFYKLYYPFVIFDERIFGNAYAKEPLSGLSNSDIPAK